MQKESADYDALKNNLHIFTYAFKMHFNSLLCLKVNSYQLKF